MALCRRGHAGWKARNFSQRDRTALDRHRLPRARRRARGVMSDSCRCLLARPVWPPLRVTSVLKSCGWLPFVCQLRSYDRFIGENRPVFAKEPGERFAHVTGPGPTDFTRDDQPAKG
jgi:hypothetical protein